VLKVTLEIYDERFTEFIVTFASVNTILAIICRLLLGLLVWLFPHLP
jgi:hypothetical protein